MFGYIKASKGEMRVKDYEVYRAVYCTLCRELGKSFGPFARFTLNYDFTFLAVLMLSLSPECPGFEKRRCVFNPLVKCSNCRGRPEQLSYSASVAMCMLYYKVKDDMSDRGWFRRIPLLLAYPWFASARKKAAARYPEADRIMAEMMIRQQRVENTGQYSVDAAAEPTAWALSRLFTDGYRQSQRDDRPADSLEAPTVDPESACAPRERSDAAVRVLERLGYCLGRWVYLVDAMNDMEEDLRYGQYNPYVPRYGLTAGDAPAIVRARQDILPGLNVCISEACSAFELLPIHHFREIIHNILYYGLEEVQNSVAAGVFRRSDRREKK